LKNGAHDLAATGLEKGAKEAVQGKNWQQGSRNLLPNATKPEKGDSASY
jgi:hypothetical protein